MTENWVRCGRCHEVFDAEAGPCLKCGTPYQPPAAAPAPYDGLYADRYAGTAFVPAPEAPPVVPRRARNYTGMLMGAGAALIAAALLIGVLIELGAGGSPGPTQPVYIVQVPETASPTPTLPPTIALTLSQLSDPKLSAHVTVQSNIQLSSRVLGKSESMVVKFDGEVSQGNQWGNLQSAGVQEEMRLVNGQIYTRQLPSGRWSLLAEMPAYLVICPVFGLDSTRDLQLVGQETKERPGGEPLPVDGLVDSGHQPGLDGGSVVPSHQARRVQARSVGHDGRRPGRRHLLGDELGHRRNQAARHRGDLHVLGRRRAGGDRRPRAGLVAVAEHSHRGRHTVPERSLTQARSG